MVTNFGQTEPQLAVTSAVVTKCAFIATGYTTLTIPNFHQIIFKCFLMLPIMLLHHEISDEDLWMEQCNVSVNTRITNDLLGT